MATLERDLDDFASFSCFKTRVQKMKDKSSTLHEMMANEFLRIDIFLEERFNMMPVGC